MTRSATNAGPGLVILRSPSVLFVALFFAALCVTFVASEVHKFGPEMNPARIHELRVQEWTKKAADASKAGATNEPETGKTKTGPTQETTAVGGGSTPTDSTGTEEPRKMFRLPGFIGLGLCGVFMLLIIILLCVDMRKKKK